MLSLVNSKVSIIDSSNPEQLIDDFFHAKQQGITTNETKILRLAIFDWLENERTDFSINAKDFSKLVSNSDTSMRRFYKEIDTFTSTLQQKFLKIKQQNSYIQFNWVSYSIYDEYTDTIKIKLHEGLYPFLKALKTQYEPSQLNDIMNMKGVHSIHLYELLCIRPTDERINTVEGVHISYSFKELIDIMDCASTSYTTRRRYAFFKIRILEPAIKEIFDKTEYAITMTKYEDDKDEIYFKFLVKKKQFLSEQEIQSFFLPEGHKWVGENKEGEFNCKYAPELLSVLLKENPDINSSGHVMTFELKELTDTLQCSDKYKHYSVLKNSVLLPALKEIERLSDYLVLYKYEKTGKGKQKKINIIFTIKHQREITASDMELFQLLYS